MAKEHRGRSARRKVSEREAESVERCPGSGAGQATECADLAWATDGRHLEDTPVDDVLRLYGCDIMSADLALGRFSDVLKLMPLAVIIDGTHPLSNFSIL